MRWPQVVRDQLRRPHNTKGSTAKYGDQAAQAEVSDSEASEEEDAPTKRSAFVQQCAPAGSLQAVSRPRETLQHSK